MNLYCPSMQGLILEELAKNDTIICTGLAGLAYPYLKRITS